MKRLLLLTVVLILFLPIWGCGSGKDEADKGGSKAAMPLEFSAAVVNTAAGQTMKAKIYMKPEKFRTDDELSGSSTIVRMDLNKVITLIRPQKTYMEMEGIAGVESMSRPAETLAGEVSRREMGRETIDGHPATKYEITVTAEGKTVKSYQWWATDLHFPIKTAAADGSWTTAYQEIQIGAQPDKLFEVPAGYQKMTMPGVGNLKGLIPGMGK